MYSTDKKFTRLTLENDENKFIWETPYNDVSIEDLIHAFFSSLVGMTWLPNTIYDSLADYLRNHASDMFDIYEHGAVDETE